MLILFLLLNSWLLFRVALFQNVFLVWPEYTPLLFKFYMLVRHTCFKLTNFNITGLLRAAQISKELSQQKEVQNRQILMCVYLAKII
jgi:hypothetical protein